MPVDKYNRKQAAKKNIEKQKVKDIANKFCWSKNLRNLVRLVNKSLSRQFVYVKEVMLWLFMAWLDSYLLMFCKIAK